MLICILLSIPAVQTKLGKIATHYLNKDFKTNIIVHQVDLSYFGSVKFKDIEIRDHHQDSMINVKSLTTSIFSYRNILNNEFGFRDIELEGVNFIIKTYKGEEDDAFNVFIKRFDNTDGDDTPSDFLLTSTRVGLKDAYFTIYDENDSIVKPVTFKNINGDVYNLKIDGPNFSGDIRKLQFIENHNIDVKNLTTDFSYTRKEMKLINTTLETETSIVNADITFFRDGGFYDFNNRVKFDADFKDANISLIDLNKFYGEFGQKDVLHFKVKMNGTLNDFHADNLQLKSDQNLIIFGDFHIVQAFNSDDGFLIDADFDNLISDYHQLQGLLPNMLEKSMPTSFRELGRFVVSGNSLITKEMIDAQLQMNTDLGSAIVDLQLTNIANIDEASYKGHVKIIDFELGEFAKDSLLGKLSVDADINGKGFKLDNMNVTVDGDIYKHQYKDYTYQNIKMNGQLENKKFNGKLIANDDYLKFDFVGLADLSTDVYKFDFKAIIDYVDFNKINLFKLDSIAILKGDIDIKLEGNSVEDLVGEIDFTQASYTNQNDEYFFKDFNITSSFKSEERTITFNSTDILNGKIEGVFKFNELIKLAQNSIGSIYTNYQPYEVKSGQYLEFNFNIYDKVIEILFPDIKLSPNTSISGTMNADDDEFKLKIRSPYISVYENRIDSVRLDIDNKNPLFNTQLIIDKVEMKRYEISDFHLVNRTMNDTLYFRTQFYGGKDKREIYNLGFYHTIDQNNKSVIGINKSDFTYKNMTWLLNPNENKQNKVVFDNEFQEFDVQEFELVSGKQKITLFGTTFGAEQKNLNIEFENVDLAGITPDIEHWNFAGLINGGVQYNQKEGDLFPIANITIEDFFVNESYQGNLSIGMKGQNSVKKFNIDMLIENNGLNSLVAEGIIDLSPKNPTIDMNFDFEKFKLDLLSPIGDENFTNIRGFVFGNATLTGLLENPDMNGELFLDEAGLALPYLNVDYDFDGTTVVELHDQTFEIVDLTLLDIEKQTTGTLDGTISHSYWSDWRLDLNLNTNNLLVLNTEESEEELYYGQGFMDGNATITGFTDNLTIDVNGKTNKGTYFVIPLSDIKTINNSRLITFVSDKKETDEDFKLPNEILLEKFKGLTVNFNLEVTKDAVIELVMDKATGSTLKGSGTGNLQIEIDTNGKFNMYGDFIIDNGQYDFSFAGLVTKKFIANRGGTISWNGNPYTADLNIETVLRVYANPKTILESVSTNRDIPVDLVARFTGELYDSQIEYDINIPDADSDVKSELDFKINQSNNKIMHFGSLLIFGNFYNDESTLFQNGKGLGADTAYQMLSAALSGIISSGNDNFKFGIDYRAADKTANIESLNNEDRVDINVATKINDRILFDGKLGVPVGSSKQSTVIGEARVEFLLNEQGTLRSNVFNRQNEIQYNDEEEGYTQGVGLSYQFDFDNGRELLEKLGLRKKEVENDSIEVKKDSIQLKPIVSFKPSKKE